MERIKEMIIKQKKILFSVTVILIVIMAAAIILLTRTHNKLELKKETVTVEYGNVISTDAKEYLSKDVDQDIIKKTKIISNIKNEKDKTYPAVGSYKITLSYEDEKAVVKVKVKDTIKPKFNTCDSIEVLKDGAINYGNYVKAEDLSEVKVAFEDKEVNLATAGEYTLKATATDTSKNKTTKDVKVVVKEVDTANNDVTVETDEKGNVILKVTEKLVEQNSVISNSRGNSSTSGNGSSNSQIDEYKRRCEQQGGKFSSSNNTCNWSFTTPEVDMSTHVHEPSAFNMYFNTSQEADAWAENYIYTQSFPWQYSGYGWSSCSCGKYAIWFY